MLIAAFARRCGLTVDTVRFYVRNGLLLPQTGQRGGSRPYLVFSEVDLEAVSRIRIGQALGLTLRQIKDFLDRFPASQTLSPEMLDAFTEQRDLLVRKVDELNQWIAFVDAKIGLIRELEREAERAAG